MFKVGDNIVYPMYGAGTINDISEREVMGEMRQYYMLYLPHIKMDVMIPVANSDAIGVRSVISPEDISTVLEVLHADSDPMPDNWNKRYRVNTDKLKSGDILLVASVVRNLVRSDRTKKLSTGEKKLLGNAKQILESELMLSGGYSKDQAEDLIDANI